MGNSIRNRKINYQCDSVKTLRLPDYDDDDDDDDNKSYYTNIITEVAMEKDSVRKKRQMSQIIKTVIDGDLLGDLDDTDHSDLDHSSSSFYFNNSFQNSIKNKRASYVSNKREKNVVEDCPSLFSASSKDFEFDESFTETENNE